MCLTQSTRQPPPTNGSIIKYYFTRRTSNSTINSSNVTCKKCSSHTKKSQISQMSVDINNNNSTDINNNSSKEIIKKQSEPFYYYIKEGDFDLVWPNVIVFTIGNLIYFYALLFTQFSWKTWVWEVQLGNFAGFSIGCGAHRLWSHKSYEASLPLRIFYAIGQTISGQNCIYIWCRDHRLHHKFSDTDGDPHNTRRGYFFAHVGWLLRKKHPEIKMNSSKLDMSDLMADPVVRFQRKYYYYLYWVFAIFLPIAVPVYFWNESLLESFLGFIIRYLTTLHSTWFVNSTAHMFGDKPYNRNIAPVENSWVSATTFGEGYHNYHHTFPWDYSAAELNYGFNLNRKFIELTVWLGLAGNLKRPSAALVQLAKDKIRSHDEMHDFVNGRGY